MPSGTTTPGNASRPSICMKSPRYSSCNSIARKRPRKRSKFGATTLRDENFKWPNRCLAWFVRGFLCIVILAQMGAFQNDVKKTTCGKSQVAEREFTILCCVGLMRRSKCDKKNENRAVKPGSCYHCSTGFRNVTLRGNCGALRKELALKTNLCCAFSFTRCETDF